MKIRDKTLVILGITFIFLFVFLMVASEQIIGNSFEHLEKDEVSRNVGRATAAMDAKLAVLNMTTYDYALWDKTALFVQGQDEGYVDETLSPEIISNLDASMVLFYDSTDKLYYAVAVDSGTTERTNISTTVLDYIAANERIFSHTAPDSQVSGIINSPEGPLLIASHPITQSSGEGPIAGTLIFAKFIDAELIKKLSGTTSLSLSAEVFNQERAASYASAAASTPKDDNSLNINYVSEASVIGTTVLNDINGEPVLFLDVEMPRDIYQHGRSAIKYMLVAILGMGVVFELVLSFSLEKSVLSRISLLNTNLTEITKKGSLSSRINMEGKDEIYDLAGNINYMLKTLDENKKALESHVLETLKIIESSLDSMDAGIMIVGMDRCIMNNKFIAMWDISADLISQNSEAKVIEHVIAQAGDGRGGTAEIKNLQNASDRDRVTVYLKNEVIYDWCTGPLHRNGKVIG
ncbi:MAG: CHASE4 domain-containing protein, partial [Methanosarcina sp.]|nr:CHASE4 domain-containing protein [Methanosarcina sp.]